MSFVRLKLSRYSIPSPVQLAALAVFCTVCSCSPAFAVDGDLQLWTPITLDVPLHNKVRAYFEVTPRVGQNISTIRQLVLRPSLEYRVREGFSVFTGYGWLTTYTDTDVLHENRVWEQLLFNKDIKRLSVINRSRLEQRFFSDSDETGVRARHLVKLNQSLVRKIYATASNELFVNLNSVKDGPQRGIDQNRFFAGIGLKATKQARVEFGYQYQYVNRTDPFDDQANQAIVLQTFVGLKD